jgi:hypothetical protein
MRWSRYNRHHRHLRGALEEGVGEIGAGVLKLCEGNSRIRCVRRLRKWFFNAFVVLSFALFVALSIICIAGFSHELDVSRSSPTTYVSAWSSWGRFWMNFGAVDPGQSFPMDPAAAGATDSRWAVWIDNRGSSNATINKGFHSYIDTAGFRFRTGRQMNGHWAIASVPGWFPIGLTVAFPAYVLIRRVWRSNAKLAGRCAVCGYDLRGTPDRCPECGKLVEKVI